MEEDRLTLDQVALLAWTQEHRANVIREIGGWSDDAVTAMLAELTALWSRVHGDAPSAAEVAALFEVPQTWARERMNRMFERVCLIRIAQIDEELADPAMKRLPVFRRRKIATRLRAERRHLRAQIHGYHVAIGNPDRPANSRWVAPDPE